MNVLIIGGNGFLGSHLQDVYANNGCNVSVLDRKEEEYRQSAGKALFYCGDLGDAGILKKALRNVDVIVHAASSSVPSRSAANPIADINDNLVPLLRLLRLIDGQKIKKFIFLSSGGTVYGGAQRLPIDEKHPTNPIVSHGIVKLAMENYLGIWSRSSGNGVVVLRLGNAYGERQNPFGQFGAINTFLGCLARKRPIVLWGDGNIVRDYVHVSDVASACLSAAKGSVEGIINIAFGKGYSLLDIMGIIVEVSGIKEISIEKKPGRKYDVPCVVLDISAAKELLHWEPIVSIHAGVKSTWDWVRSLSR